MVRRSMGTLSTYLVVSSVLLLCLSGVYADPEYLLYDFSNNVVLSASSASPSVSSSVYSAAAIGYEVDFSLSFADGETPSGTLTSSVDSSNGKWTTTATSSTETAVAVMLLNGMNPYIITSNCRMYNYAADVMLILDMYALDIDTIEIDYAVAGTATIVLSFKSFSVDDHSPQCNSCSKELLVMGSSITQTQTWTIDIMELPAECAAVAWSVAVEVDVYAGSAIAISRVELIPSYSGDDYIDCLDIFSLYDQAISPVTISTLPGYYDETLQQEYTDDTTYFGTVFENMGVVGSIMEIQQGYGTASIWYDDETLFLNTYGPGHFVSNTALTFFSFFTYNTNLYTFCPNSELDGTREGFFLDIYSEDYIVPIIIQVQILDYNLGEMFLCEAIVDMTGEIFVPFDAFRAMDSLMSTIVVNDFITCEILMEEVEQFSVYITSTMTTEFEIRSFKIVQY